MVGRFLGAISTQTRALILAILLDHVNIVAAAARWRSLNVRCAHVSLRRNVDVGGISILTIFLDDVHVVAAAARLTFAVLTLASAAMLT
jgi:hypothetical protein